MKAALEANGWTSDSKVRVLADGADGLSNLVDAATGKPSARVLDWFHQPADHPVLVTMAESEYLRGYLVRAE